jgi:NADH-quinone oxidoreductase subunit D
MTMATEMNLPKTDYRTMTLNMGPQHPSTHGVLRLELELDGEIIQSCRPHIGFLHTGVEKQAEYKTYHQVIPMTDRLDYLAPMSNNLAYVLAVEKLCEIDVPKRAQYIRVMMAELTRIASHLVWLGTHAMDIGAMSVFLYCFREREMILDIYEELSGVRMMSSYIRIGGVHEDITERSIQQIREFIKIFPSRWKEYDGLLTKNRIFVNRIKGIGKISKEEAINLGLSGPSLRGSGVNWDLRKTHPYSSYQDFDFEVCVEPEGDIYSRYLVRLREMLESLKIVKQALDNMPEGPVLSDNRKFVAPPKPEAKKNMEQLIHHFILYSEGFKAPEGEIYHAIEAPKGELGVFLASDGSNKPYRMHWRGPSFVNLQSLQKIAKGMFIADMVAMIGSIDIVLGEVDR